jgi:hypothetical protein
MPGGAVQVLDYYQHDTPGFVAGDLVTVDSAGLVKVASADSAVIGIAREDADTSDTNKKIKVELLDINAIYSVRITDSGSDTTTGATDTIIGDAIAFSNMGTGAQVISDTAGDSAVAYVVQRDPRDTSGTVGGRFLVRFKSNVLAEQY